MSDKIKEKNKETNSYVNDDGEHLKFTKGSMSIYSGNPKEKHNSYHVKYDSDKGTVKTKYTERHDDGTETKTEEEGNCYLTSACMKHFQENFDDKGYELQLLRWFRDNYVSKEDIEHYYQTAPIVVSAIEEDNKCDNIYKNIYEDVIKFCIDAIESGNYVTAYDTYKNSILNLEEEYAKKHLQKRLVKVLKKI